MRWISVLIFCLISFLGRAQNYQSNWDAYQMEINKKPVSIIVDLGLVLRAPLKERPFAIIVRASLKNPDYNGLPVDPEIQMLDKLEDSLVYYLDKSSGGVYAGRFTQRGLREFYFYALDTVNYLAGVAAAFQNFNGYKWLTIAKEDKTWRNYFDVLYPPPAELERIQNRRVVDQLRSKGDLLKESRKIDHFIFFKTKVGREEFLRGLKENGFKIEEMPDEPGAGETPYKLHLSRVDRPDYVNIDKVTLYLWDLARKYNGRYDGWETYVVK
jgi:uncharacterized protein (TIGR01619 family)